MHRNLIIAIIATISLSVRGSAQEANALGSGRIIAADSTRADKDYSRIRKLTRLEPMVFMTTAESRSSFSGAWVDIRRRTLLPLVSQFFHQYAEDPRRWGLVVDVAHNRPFFIQDYDQAARMYAAGTPELIQRDTAAERAWEQQYSVLRAQFEASVEMSDSLRMMIRQDELLTALAAMRRKARRGETVDVRSVQDSLLAYSTRFLPRDRFATERLTHFLLDPAVRATDLGAFPEFLEKARSNADTILQQWATRVKLTFTNPTVLKGVTLDGASLDLATYRGKVVFLDFWGTGCSSCIEAFPKLKKLYEQYRKKGVEFIGVVIDYEDRRTQAASLVRQHALPWPQLFTGSAVQDVIKDFGIAGLPNGMIINQDGILVGRSYVRPADIAATIDQLLAAQPER